MGINIDNIEIVLTNIHKMIAQNGLSDSVSQKDIIISFGSMVWSDIQLHFKKYHEDIIGEYKVDHSLPKEGFAIFKKNIYNDNMEEILKGDCKDYL